MITEEEVLKRVAASYEVSNAVLEAQPSPLVTVRSSVFQHRDFIEKCIEGVLMQETDFQFEYIIGEDFSTDGTREIVFEYAEKYPDRIRLFTADQNVGSKANGRRCINAARGKYMALCEGDDYWTDPHKLQKQVDFLEGNPDYNLCFHDVRVLKPDGQLVEDKITKVPKQSTDLRDFLTYGNYIHTPSVMIRNTVKALPEEFIHSPVGDFLSHAFVIDEGKAMHLPEIMAVYREGVGIWSTQKQEKRVIGFVKALAVLAQYYGRISNHEGENILRKRISRYFKSEFLKKKQDTSEVQAEFIQMIFEKGLNNELFNSFKWVENAVHQNYRDSKYIATSVPFRALLKSLILKFKNWFR